MSLRDAEPTRVDSDSSSDSDILDDNSRFSDLDHHDDHQDVLGTGLGVAPCSPQPYQSNSHQSEYHQLKQASLEKVSAYVTVYMYSGTLLNGHPSTVDIYDITDTQVSRMFLHIFQYISNP